MIVQRRKSKDTAQVGSSPEFDRPGNRGAGVVKGNRNRRPTASAEGIGLEEEPSLRETTGEPPKGGSPPDVASVADGKLRWVSARTSTFRPRTLISVSVEAGTPGWSRETGEARIGVTLSLQVRTPRGRDFGRASSGFLFVRCESASAGGLDLKEIDDTGGAGCVELPGEVAVR
ncbi:MAG: hypothetical protein BMS9Abin20_1176 [Acidimicrobiia bacterium]|nr:MAG: hypothetical protein BMS9Abin20_1176 [Acidimicrobiia bacterium]